MLAPCGADKPAETLDVVSATVPTLSKTYYDTFYHCSEDGLTHVEGLDSVYDALYKLTK